MSKRMAMCDRCDAVRPVEELQNANTFLFCKNGTDCLARKHHADTVARERDEARTIACKLLYIAEHRGPKVFGPRPDWLKPNPDG